MDTLPASTTLDGRRVGLNLHWRSSRKLLTRYFAAMSFATTCFAKLFEMAQSVSRKLTVLYRQIRAALAQFIEQSNWERIAPDKIGTNGNTPASMENQQC